MSLFTLACERCGRIYRHPDYCHPWRCEDCENLPAETPNPPAIQTEREPEPIAATPAGDLGPVEIEVRDYDTEGRPGEEDERIKEDEKGDPYFCAIFKNPA